MSHIAIQEKLNGSPVNWLEKVSDEQTAGALASTEIDQDRITIEFDGKGPKIDADRRGLCLAGSIVEPAVMLRTLDNVADDQAIGQVGLFVRAKAVRREVFVVRRTVDGVGFARVIEPDDVLHVDIANFAGFDPVGHHKWPPL
jgi:hypothetical protein